MKKWVKGIWRHQLAFYLLPLTFCLLTACSARPIDNQGPVLAVERFVAALEQRDPSAIIDQLEPTEWRKEIGPELRSYLSHIAEIAISDEAYTVEQNDGELAVVRLTGTLSYTLAESEVSGERPVDLQIEVVRVGDTWYLRGLELPQPGG